MKDTMVISVVCPEGVNPGDTFEVEVAIPAKEKKPRGQLAGIALEDMTLEQLKREKINAGSVLYKAKQRGAAEATIEANQARFDAVVAEIAKRKPAKEVTADAVEAALEETATAEDSVYDSAVAAEV